MNLRAVLGSLVVGTCLIGWFSLQPADQDVPPRTTVLRVSLDQDYVVCLPILDTSRTLPDFDCDVEHLQREAKPTNTRSGETFSDPHEDGVSDLVYAAKYPDLLSDAVRKLEDAVYVVETDPRTMALRHNDLAAAYFQRALENDAPLDLLRALDSVEQAVLLDPESEPGAFNRATLLQILNLRERATEAWERYLELDPVSPWADEARESLETLTLEPVDTWDVAVIEAAIDAGDSEQLRSLVQGREGRGRGQVDRWLQSWAGAVADGDETKAADQLRRARVLAELVAASNGDRWALDSVQVVEGVAGEQRAALVEAYRLFREGVKGLKPPFAFAAAQIAFTGARDRFEAAGHPLRLESQKYIEQCDLFFDEANKDLAELRRAYDRLRQEADPSYLHFLVGLDLQEGLTHVQDFNLGAALAIMEPAWQAARRLGEKGLVTQARTYLGELYDYLGDPEGAWATRYGTLQSLTVSSTSSRHEVLGEGAYSLVQAGWSHAALQFLNEALAQFQGPEEESLRSLPYLRRAQILAQLDRFEEARESLQAGQACMQVIDAGLRPRYEAEEGWAQALLSKEQDPQGAVQTLTQVVEGFEGGNHLLQLPALLARADIQARLGDPAAAVEDLERALATYQDVRSDDSFTPWVRMQVFEQSRVGFESLVLRYLELGDPEAALEVSEQLRARVLLDQSFSSTNGLDPDTTRAEPLTVAQIQARLPEDMAIVSTLVLPDRLIVWRLQQGHDPVVQQRTDLWREGRDFRTALRLAVEAQHPTSGKTEAEVAEAARYVANVLGVDGDAVPEDVPFIFIPDHSLHMQPFSALPTAEGKFLIERHPIGIALSLSMFLQSTDPAREQRFDASESVTALIVGNPEMDQALEAAGEEAREVAAMYPGATLLTGPDATREAVLEALAQSPEVVHFATHGYSNSQKPLRASLQLAVAADATDDGKLYAEDLYKLQLPTTRLVVVAACDTGVGDFTTNEGPLHLARPFLAAGVPAVVATLWKVDDEVAQRVMVRFHEELRRGSDPMEALRVAQRDSLKIGGSGSSWSGFTAVDSSFIE